MLDNNGTVIPAYLIDYPGYNDIDFWVRCTGDAMSGKIDHGDKIGIKEVKNWRRKLILGEVYAIVTNQFRTVKWVNKKTESSLILTPNVDWISEQEIDKDLITKVFHVKTVIKDF